MTYSDLFDNPTRTEEMRKRTNTGERIIMMNRKCDFILNAEFEMDFANISQQS